MLFIQDGMMQCGKEAAGGLRYEIKHITVKQIKDTVQLCKAGGYIPNAVQHTIGQMLKGDIDDIGLALNKAVMCPYDGTAQLLQGNVCGICFVCKCHTGDYIFMQTDGLIQNIGLPLYFSEYDFQTFLQRTHLIAGKHHRIVYKPLQLCDIRICIMKQVTYFPAAV